MNNPNNDPIKNCIVNGLFNTNNASCPMDSYGADNHTCATALKWINRVPSMLETGYPGHNAKIVDLGCEGRRFLIHQIPGVRSMSVDITEKFGQAETLVKGDIANIPWMSLELSSRSKQG